MAKTKLKNILYILALYHIFQSIRKKIYLKDYDKKAIYITGCDSGFGKSTALQLAKKGCIIFAGCLFTNSFEHFKDYKNIIPIQVDVTKMKSCKSAATIIERYLLNHTEITFHALLNNAGILRSGPLDCVQISDWLLQFQVNVLGMLRSTLSVLPLLRKYKSRLINVASVAGFVATPDTSGYNASKFAVQGLSDAWRRELKKWGIQVIIIEPGIMKTPLWDVPLSMGKILEQKYDRLPKNVQQVYGKEYFLRRYHASKELVELIRGNPQMVVDNMESAILSKYPPSRYTVGYDTPLWKILRIIPTWLADFLLELSEKAFMGNALPQALTLK